MRTLVLGVGNEIRRDDSIGIDVVKRMSEEMDELEIEFKETSSVGLPLLDTVEEFQKVFIVDSIMTEDGKPGNYYSLTLDDFDVSKNQISSHTVNLKTLWEMGDTPEESMPEVRIFAVEVEDPFTFDEELSEEVSENLPEIVKSIGDEIREEVEKTS